MGARSAHDGESAVSVAPHASDLEKSDTAFRVPPALGDVSDFAHVLADSARRVLEDSVRSANRTSDGEIAVITMNDLRGFSPESLARRIGNEWSIGAGRAGGAGVVVLIIPRESSADGRGHCRIELTAGATTFVPDSVATRVCSAAIPAFKLRNYGDGMLHIITDLSGLLRDKSRQPAGR